MSQTHQDDVQSSPHELQRKLSNRHLQLIAIGGAIGIKIPEPGARLGALNTSQNILVAFTATGGTPQLSEVNAGAGTVYLAYALAPV